MIQQNDGLIMDEPQKLPASPSLAPEMWEEQLRSMSEIAKEALAGLHGKDMKERFEKRRADQDNSKWAQGYREIFPHVKPWKGMAPMALWTIAHYAREIGITPLKRNHVRSFIQPWGWVAGGVDVDFVTGIMVRYPGTHGTANICEQTASPESLIKLKRLLNSDAFRKVHEENLARGNDGCSVLIEVDLDGIYSWKCHWCSKSKVFREVAELLQTLA